MPRYEDSGQVMLQFDEIDAWAQPGERVTQGGYTITAGSQHVTITDSRRVTGLGENGDVEGWRVSGQVAEDQVAEIQVWCETPG